MTNREREFYNLGFEYCEGIEFAQTIIIPSTGRQIRKVNSESWEVQPKNDNYWLKFDNLVDAIKCGTGIKYDKE